MSSMRSVRPSTGARIGWNPIQTGDDFGHASRVLEHRNDGSTLYVKCVPMQWPLDDVPGECTFECWITLDGAAVQVRSRLDNARTDKTQYTARRQELPAVYVNGPYDRLLAYTGDQPFSGGALMRIAKPASEPGPWTRWNSAENWSALVRDDGWGLGVWHPGCFSFGGGFAGPPGKGGPHDAPTGYISPGHVEVIDWNIRHEYRYALILGTLDEIRRYVYRHPRRLATPDFHFQRDRQHWYFVNVRDAGWPLRSEWRVTLDRDDPQLISPDVFWQASDVPTLYLLRRVSRRCESRPAILEDVRRAGLFRSQQPEIRDRRRRQVSHLRVTAGFGARLPGRHHRAAARSRARRRRRRFHRHPLDYLHRAGRRKLRPAPLRFLSRRREFKSRPRCGRPGQSARRPSAIAHACGWPSS